MPTRQSALRILFIGGTGFIGPHMVRRALERGHQVTLFNRGRSNPHLFPTVEKLIGDRDGGLGILKGRSWDAVIDTSGYLPRTVRDSARLLQGSVHRYLFVSTGDVYATFSTPNLDENAPLDTLEGPRPTMPPITTVPSRYCASGPFRRRSGSVHHLSPGMDHRRR
jgi:2'-hydroxyisoflavone reductase